MVGLNSDGVNVFSGNGVEEMGVPMAQMDKNCDDAIHKEEFQPSTREWCVFEDPPVQVKLSAPIRCSLACTLHAKQSPVGASQPPPPSPYDADSPPAPHEYNIHQRRVDIIMEGARAELLRAKHAAATAPLDINAKRERLLATQIFKRAHSLLIQSM